MLKLLEIRDKGTFLPMFAFSTTVGTSQEQWLLRRAGYAYDSPCIMFGYLGQSGQKACYDPYDWNDRTKQTAHHYIEKNWDKIRSGDVIDVEFILGETTEPKISEREAA
jgi:hypothetical protein